ncbi:hypothetical protein ACFLQN_02280 [Candidatus Aenigmatarchaeota archaeon]
MKINKEFIKYKNNKKLTTHAIGKKLGISKTTVQAYFKKDFGNEYTKIAKRKSAWMTKIDENHIRKAFEKYKAGTLITEIAENVGVKRDSLTHRFTKVIGEDYIQLAKKRKYIDAGMARKKRIPNKIIKNNFEKYKKTRIPVKKLAESIGITESSLIFRFKKIFGDEYKKIAYSRRDERKVTKKEYRFAFEKYKNTNVSLTELSEQLGIRISSLAPKFKRMFGDEYRKIAIQKQNLVEVNKRGRKAEELAIKYFTLTGLKIYDVRRKRIIKDSLKTPDFIVENTFIEVKNNYVTMEGFGNVKGYEHILNDYLNKIANHGHEMILKNGIIVSFSGFSPVVRKQSLIDKITLIGPKEIEEIFRNNNRLDLLTQLNELRGLS